ncbi:MAG: GtrA family protein [Clostridia bacterium]|nr:GtrA family protein [Clostridia bacterium]
MSKESIKQAAKFSLVGVFNTAVDYGVFYVMLAFFNVDKSISQIFATAVAMCGSYIINKYWTFSQKGKSNTQIVKFILTNIVSMSCTIVFMNIFHDFLHIHEWANSLINIVGISYRLDGDVSVIFCKIVASFLSLVINFLGNKFWVFAKK